MDALPALRFTGADVVTGIADALVIGGGPAGSALAQLLAAAGRHVMLVERTPGPHDKVCGEFLSHEALHYLELLDVIPRDLGAVPIEAVRIVARRARTSCRLPFRALSLSRRRLDEALFDRARAAGAVIRRGKSVNALEPSGPGWTARLSDDEILSTRHVFVATGKHEIRGWKRPPGRQNDLIGLKLHLRLTQTQTNAIQRMVELILFPGGYGGLQPIEDGKANLCLLVRKARFKQATNSVDVLLAQIERECPHLAQRLQGAEAVQQRPLTIASIPYGLVRKTTMDRCWHLGDQAAVIPSFAGEGMSIALHSAHLAAQCHLAGRSAQDFQQLLASDVSAQIRRATLLSHLLVRRRCQTFVAHGAGFVPSILAMIAASTRLPMPAVARVAGY